MRKLNWFERGPGTTRESVRALESELGVRFPEDYVVFVCGNAGASNPDEGEIIVHRADGRDFVANFGYALDLGDESEPGSIRGTLAALAVDEQLPPRVVPFAGSGSGDFMCFDFRFGRPTVVYFSHSLMGPDSLSFLAATFSGFLDLLAIPEDDEEDEVDE